MEDNNEGWLKGEQSQSTSCLNTRENLCLPAITCWRVGKKIITIYYNEHINTHKYAWVLFTLPKNISLHALHSSVNFGFGYAVFYLKYLWDLCFIKKALVAALDQRSFVDCVFTYLCHKPALTADKLFSSCSMSVFLLAEVSEECLCLLVLESWLWAENISNYSWRFQPDPMAFFSKWNIT